MPQTHNPIPAATTAKDNTNGSATPYPNSSPHNPDTPLLYTLLIVAITMNVTE